MKSVGLSHMYALPTSTMTRVMTVELRVGLAGYIIFTMEELLSGSDADDCEGDDVNTDIDDE